MADDPITFLAAFPPIQSAITRSGNGDGMRIMLDIPESEMANALWLNALVQERLRVTIEVVNDDRNRTPGRRNIRKRDQ